MLRNASPSSPGSAAFAWRHARLIAACGAAAAVLAGCGGVQIKPSAALPKPLVVVMPAHVGLVIPSDMRSFAHSETRWGVEWTITLGEGHRNLMLEVLKDEFSDVQEFRDVDAAK